MDLNINFWDIALAAIIVVVIWRLGIPILAIACAALAGTMAALVAFATWIVEKVKGE